MQQSLPVFGGGAAWHCKHQVSIQPCAKQCCSKGGQGKGSGKDTARGRDWGDARECWAVTSGAAGVAPPDSASVSTKAVHVMY